MRINGILVTYQPFYIDIKIILYHHRYYKANRFMGIQWEFMGYGINNIDWVPPKIEALHPNL